MHADPAKLQAHFEAAAERLLMGKEKLLPLGKACEFLNATRGEKVSTASLCRWILRGKEGIRLDAIRLNGGGWWTSREALARFAAALSARIAGKALTAIAPPSALERQAEEVYRELRAEGVGI